MKLVGFYSCEGVCGKGIVGGSGYSSVHGNQSLAICYTKISMSEANVSPLV